MKLNLPFGPKSKTAASPSAKASGDAPVSQAAQFNQGLSSVKDIIAPGAIEIDFNFQKIANTYFRTLFVSGYPRFVNANWLSPLINFDHSLNIAMYIYPIEGKG